MIKFITVWYLIIVPYNTVHYGESLAAIQIPYATQAICEKQATHYRSNGRLDLNQRFSNSGKIDAHCQFGQIPVYIGNPK